MRSRQRILSPTAGCEMACMVAGMGGGCVPFGVATAEMGESENTIMANENAAAESTEQIDVHTIGIADLREVILKGFADFDARPSHYFFLGLIYPAVTFLAIRASAGYEMLPLLFPLLAGSTLLGPLAATGLYEMSRRREDGLDVSWSHAFDIFRTPALRPLIALGIVLMAVFVTWLKTAQSIYEGLFGTVPPESVSAFIDQILTTQTGLVLFVVGGSVGFLFAVVVLTISVISFPMLVDRNVGAVIAVQTSVRAVIANPVTMALWGLIVAGSLLIGALPFFIGLAVVMPVLGHATWHLYRKVIEH